MVRNRFDEAAAAELGWRAAQLEPRLVGLSTAAAQALVDAHEGLTVRFTANGVVTADFRPGRIDAYVRDGVVVDQDTFEALPRVEMSGDAIVLHDEDGPVTWPDLDALAAQYWAWERRHDEDFAACDCVQDATEPLLPQWPALVRALLDAAETDEEVTTVGAQVLQQVLGADARGVIDEVERAARHDPRYRAALTSVTLHDGLPRDVRSRLRALRR